MPALLVAAVVGLAVLRATVGRSVAGLLVAGLLGVRGTRLLVAAVAGILLPTRGRSTVVVIGWWGRVPASGRGPVLRRPAVSGRRLPVALVIPRGAVAGRGPLLVTLAVTLVGVALPGRVALVVRRCIALLRGCVALLRGCVALLRGVGRPLRFGCCGARILLGPPVLIVVVLVAGTSLALAAAVLVVGHRWHSWFCGVRMVRFCCGGWGGVGVDDGSGAVLAGVQAPGLLEAEDHFTIGLPLLLLNISRQVLGERFRGQFAVSAYLLKIGHTEGNDIVVGSQEHPAGQSLHPVESLPTQQGLDLLRND